MQVYDPGTGAVYGGHEAMNSVLRRYLPWSMIVWIVEVVPGVSYLEGVAYQRFARHRASISKFLRIDYSCDG
jgi:hypothetical protein